MTPNLEIIGMAVFSLILGILFYMWQIRSKNSYFFTAIVSWLLVALFPVLLIFSFFPETTFSGTIEKVTMTGAIGAFIFIWLYGIRKTEKTWNIDQRIKEMNTKIQELEKERKQLQNIIRPPLELRETQIFYYKLKNRQDKQIALITGDIRSVKVADIWVNSENTNMQMARYYEGSISGVIRYYGAKRDNAGVVIEDVIANELAKEMGAHRTVEPATVLFTNAGELQITNNVKKIFHVASVKGEIGSGYSTINNIEMCITNSLMLADNVKLQSLKLKSILFPLMGTGVAKGDLKNNAERLIQAAISFLETNENSKMECIYFLIRTDVQLETCKTIMEKSDKLKVSSTI